MHGRLAGREGDGSAMAASSSTRGAASRAAQAAGDDDSIAFARVHGPCVGGGRPAAGACTQQTTVRAKGHLGSARGPRRGIDVSAAARTTRWQKVNIRYGGGLQSTESDEYYY